MEDKLGNASQTLDNDYQYLFIAHYEFHQYESGLPKGNNLLY
jgi:hypothetical protein